MKRYNVEYHCNGRNMRGFPLSQGINEHGEISYQAEELLLPVHWPVLDGFARAFVINYSGHSRMEKLTGFDNCWFNCSYSNHCKFTETKVMCWHHLEGNSLKQVDWRCQFVMSDFRIFWSLFGYLRKNFSGRCCKLIRMLLYDLRTGKCICRGAS